MDGGFATATLYGLGTLGAVVAAAGAKSRLDLSRAKHRSLKGHSRIARALAKLLPSYQYDEARIFEVDGAPEAVAAARRDDFHRLAALFCSRHPKTLQLTRETTGLISDMQFTEAYRVPFQFSPYVRRHLPVGTFAESSAGVKVTDLDGNEFYDLTGSYGVNLLGYDF